MEMDTAFGTRPIVHLLPEVLRNPYKNAETQFWTRCEGLAPNEVTPRNAWFPFGVRSQRQKAQNKSSMRGERLRRPWTWGICFTKKSYYFTSLLDRLKVEKASPTPASSDQLLRGLRPPPQRRRRRRREAAGLSRRSRRRTRARHSSEA